jgi:uncharacterized membrane protein YfcA
MGWVWVGVFAAVTLSSTAQAVSGFGFALIGTPLVAILVGPKEAVVGLTMIGIVLVAQLSLRSRGHVEWPVVLVVTAAAILGMPFGLLVLERADDRTLTAIIAVVVIAFAILLWRGLRLLPNRVTDGIAGFVAGILSTSTSTSGPPIVIALSGKDMSPAAFRGTISAIFFVQGSVAMVAFALGGGVTSGALAVAAAGLPGLLVGSYVGEHGFKRIDAETFRRIVFAMLLLSGVVSLVGALAS